MTSRLDIFNRALALIEQPGLASVEDAGLAAQTCRLFYPVGRDRLLRGYPWSFAQQRAILPALADPPAWGRSAAFAWPADALGIIDCADLDDSQWEIEGRTILADQTAPLKVRYLATITEEGRFDPLFVAALEPKLAMDIAPRLARADAAAMRRLEDLHLQALQVAWAQDAILGPTMRMENLEDPFADVLT